ncbi:MAG: hypothetical protein NOU37_09515, partial [Candidatus Brocadiales bacterium]|nr:hypothetical protein [Candidatus Bathyanammoxibius amoris]
TELTEEMVLRKPFVRKLFKSTQPEWVHRRELEKAKLEASTERYALTRNFDIVSQRYYEDRAAKQDVINFIKSAPREEKDRLVNRHKRRGKYQKLPNRGWWIDLSEINPPEARAAAYTNRWLAGSEEQRKELDRNLRRAPGITSERFLRRLGRLRRKWKKTKTPALVP